MANPDAVLVAYDNAWNARDSHARRPLLERSMLADAELVDPAGGRFAGIDEIAGRIDGFSERFPGARVRITSGVDEHHGFARYAWAITDPDGREILNGLDVVQRGDGGLIKRVIMFFGPLPPAAQ
jgi:hypothetical protein